MPVDRRDAQLGPRSDGAAAVPVESAARVRINAIPDRSSAALRARPLRAGCPRVDGCPLHRNAGNGAVAVSDCLLVGSPGSVTPLHVRSIHQSRDPPFTRRGTNERMVRAVRTGLRRAIAATAAVLTPPDLAVVSDVTPTANAYQAFNANSLESMALKSNKDFQTGLHRGRGHQRHLAVSARGQTRVVVLESAVADPRTRPDRNTQRLRATRDDTRRMEQPQRFVVDCTGNAAGGRRTSSACGIRQMG